MIDDQSKFIVAKSVPRLEAEFQALSGRFLHIFCFCNPWVELFPYGRQVKVMSPFYVEDSGNDI